MSFTIEQMLQGGRMPVTVLTVTAEGEFVEETQPTADARPYELVLLTEIRDLLRTLNDNIYSLRLDMQPLCGYYRQILGVVEEAAKEGLPMGFPGREQLEAAGITAVADIPHTIRRIEALVGGDSDLAMQIARELAVINTRTK